MLPADDYAKAVFFMQHPTRPAYVSFTTSASARGIAGDAEPSHTVFVRTKDGAVVLGSLDKFSTGHYERGGDTNPISRPAFDPNCYAATGEQSAHWDGQDVLRISLHPVCKTNDPDDDGSDNPFDTLYVNPKTDEPVGATGSFNDEGTSIDLEAHFAQFGPYVFTSDLSAHVRGHGFLFWVRERAAVTYADYKFYDRLPVIRRQSGASP